MRGYKIDCCVLIFECGSGEYCLFTEAAEYDGKWYNHRLGNSLAQFLSIPSAYKGVSPLESLGDPETVRGWIPPIG